MSKLFSVLLLFSHLSRICAWSPYQQSALLKPRRFTKTYNILFSANQEPAQTISKNIAYWFAQETLSSLFPKSTALAAIKQIKSTDIIAKNEIAFSNFWSGLEKKLTEEKRPIRAVIGDTPTQNILAFIDKSDIYDPVTVRAFLQAPAFEGNGLLHLLYLSPYS